MALYLNQAVTVRFHDHVNPATVKYIRPFCDGAMRVGLRWANRNRAPQLAPPPSP
jgi:hypothetical protein